LNVLHTLTWVYLSNREKIVEYERSEKWGSCFAPVSTCFLILFLVCLPK
jgi:hypothetical protein